MANTVIEAGGDPPTCDFVITQNERLGKDGTSTDWLNGDEILELVRLDNPDNPEAPASWISGPAPLNYFYTFFAETLANTKHHGKVHIMVVNTVSLAGAAFTATTPGQHWFVAAWLIDP